VTPMNRTTAFAAVTALVTAVAIPGCGSDNTSTVDVTDTVTDTVQTTDTVTDTVTTGGGQVNLTCDVGGLQNVEGGRTTVTVTGSEVDPSQADQATCAEAKVVARKVTASGSEMPLNADGFQCTPSVVSTGPDVVNWECTFKGADTPTDITLSFQATYTG
jgi:hypothetical protein